MGASVLLPLASVTAGETEKGSPSGFHGDFGYPHVCFRSGSPGEISVEHSVLHGGFRFASVTHIKLNVSVSPREHNSSGI